MGIIIHVTYCIIGLELILMKSSLNTIKILGAIYLLYMGISTLTSRKIIKRGVNNKIEHKSISYYKAFWTGFLTNVLNPKATLFFLSVFTLIINQDTSLFVLMLYGAWMVTITALWFCALSLILTNKIIIQTVNRFGERIEKTMGLVLILLAIKLLFVKF